MAGAVTTVSVFEPVQEPARSRAAGQWELALWQRRDKRAFIEPAQARDQRAPGVFQAVTWIAVQ